MSITQFIAHSCSTINFVFFLVIFVLIHKIISNIIVEMFTINMYKYCNINNQFNIVYTTYLNCKS